MISGVANIIIQFKLQKRESKIHKTNLREEKSLSILSELYGKLQDMTYIFNEPDNLLNMVIETERFIHSNNLFIPKELKKMSIEFCDYFKEIMTDWRNKDNKRESVFLEKFKTIFYK